jgi:hypothetical protein
MRGFGYIAAFCFFSVVLVAADNPFFGTWKLNPAKSKGTPGTMSKEEMVVFESDGGGVKRIVTGVDADGQKINLSATVPWDGKEHKVDGPMGPAMVAVKPSNDHTLKVTMNVNGKVVLSGRAVVSKNGKTMTTTFKGEDPKGRKIDNVGVYEKQ